MLARHPLLHDQPDEALHQVNALNPAMLVLCVGGRTSKAQWGTAACAGHVDSGARAAPRQLSGSSPLPFGSQVWALAEERFLELCSKKYRQARNEGQVTCTSQNRSCRALNKLFPLARLVLVALALVLDYACRPRAWHSTGPAARPPWLLSSEISCGCACASAFQRKACVTFPLASGGSWGTQLLGELR